MLNNNLKQFSQQCSNALELCSKLEANDLQFSLVVENIEKLCTIKNIVEDQKLSKKHIEQDKHDISQQITVKKQNSNKSSVSIKNSSQESKLQKYLAKKQREQKISMREAAAQIQKLESNLYLSSANFLNDLNQLYRNPSRYQKQSNNAAKEEVNSTLTKTIKKDSISRSSFSTVSGRNFSQPIQFCYAPKKTKNTRKLYQRQNGRL